MNACPFRPLRPIGQQTLTVSTSAVGFTLSNAIKNFGPTAQAGTTSTKATLAFCTVEAQPIRWSIVGTPAAATGGHAYAAGTSFWLTSDGDIEAFLAIRTGGTDGVIHATFFAE
jgi:hypothetical protein